MNFCRFLRQTSLGITRMTSPVFSFGIIADVQYADKENGSNYAKTSHRYYRGTLAIVDAAVKEWNDENVTCVVQVGDLIDGYCVDYSKKALESVMEHFAPLKSSLHHVIGNHELINFSRNELSQLLPSPFYYSFIPFKGYRFIVLNAFERSILWHNEPDLVEESYAMFETHNPNPVREKMNVDWLKGITGIQQRFVPYNGGITEQQLAWLRTELASASLENEKVVLFSHCPLQEGCSVNSTLLWNYEEVLKEIHGSPATILCCIYGHDHAGGYCKDEKGIHHVTLQSPLESAPGEVAFASVDVFENHVSIRGRGDVPSRVCR